MFAPPQGLPAALLDAVFEHAPVGLVFFDTEMRYVRINAALVATSGGSGAERYGRRPSEVHPDIGAAIEEPLRRALETGEPQLDIRVTGESATAPGQARSWQVCFHPVRDANGSLLGVLGTIDDVTDSEKLAEASRRDSDRLELLAELSSSLGRSLDVERTLHIISELVVPRLADACAVDLIEDDGRIRRMALIDDGGLPGPPLPEVQPEHLHEPPEPVARAMATGEPVRLSEIPVGLLDDITDGSGRPGRALVLPLRARGQTLGALTLAAGASQRDYWNPADYALAREVAARAAVAVDNARLFARQRDVAVTLQHSLLPQRLPDLPGVEVAARYIAGSAETEVGGDWFDIVPLADDRVGIVIGDVMGRGLRAAAVMGQLRAAVRAYAVMELPPARIVGYLDRVVQALDQVQIVTCLYAVLDPASGELVYANAGHHPPYLRRADGEVSSLSGEPDAPLGVGGAMPTERHARVPDGATLLLYTDGLVEERSRDIDEGGRRLAAALAVADPRPELLVDAVISAMGRDGGHNDDVALLALRLGGQEAGYAPPDRTAALELPGDSAVVRAARDFAADTLQRWELPELVETAMLLVSEVVTNALKHAGGGAAMKIIRTSTGIEVEVKDADDRLPSPRIVDQDAESGRGLHLVEALATSWGAEPDPMGKRVWFRLDAQPTAL